ncbi:MAG: AmmeMemoRadiSam system protein A [Bacteroidales bacterium]
MEKHHSKYVDWAWEVLYAYFERRHPQLDDMDGFEQKAACFVTIHMNADHSLRGCIGTLEPNQINLKEEIHTNTISAAFHDPRFMPLKKEEMSSIYLSVDVLDTPEVISSIDKLDPKLYGVIVESKGRRGVLLPDLPSIDTVKDQLAIAMKKGGIDSGESVELFRFKVKRYY